MDKQNEKGMVDLLNQELEESCELFKEFNNPKLCEKIAEQKAEIERLTEEKDKYQEKWQTAYMNELNLQKQVDELKAENTELYKEHTALIAGSILAKQNIAKDTAKEICDLILEHWEKKQFVECDWLRVAISERYGVEAE